MKALATILLFICGCTQTVKITEDDFIFSDDPSQNVFDVSQDSPRYRSDIRKALIGRSMGEIQRTLGPPNRHYLTPSFDNWVYGKTTIRFYRGYVREIL